MNLALITPGFSAHPNDWAIPVLQRLAVKLAREHTVHVFSLRYPTAGRFEWGGLTVHAIGGGQRFGLASAAIWRQAVQAINRQHHKTPFDILHAFWVDEPGLVAGLAGLLLRRPVVASVGGGELTYLPDINYGTQGSALRRTIIRLALRRAGQITAGSLYQAALVQQQGIAPSHLKVVPLGVDTALFQPGEPPPNAPPTLLQAASLTPVKNQILLLEILAHVRREVPAARLKVAGSGPQQAALLQLAQDKDLSQNIHWLGEVTQEQMVTFYQEGHLYVQSSRHESQGLAVLEALACGTPALGTPVGILPEVSADPPSWSAKELGRQIIALLNEPVRFTALRRQARQTAVARFSLETTLDAFRSLYQELL